MKRGLEMPESEISEVFTRWNKGVLDSFLVEITADILKYTDTDGKPLVTKIMDSAGQKVSPPHLRSSPLCGASNLCRAPENGPQSTPSTSANQ